MTHRHRRLSFRFYQVTRRGYPSQPTLVFFRGLLGSIGLPAPELLIPPGFHSRGTSPSPVGRQHVRFPEVTRQTYFGLHK